MFETNFSIIDWGIVAIYLTAIATIGVIVNRYIHNTADYMVGGRNVGASLNAASYIGTSLGLVTIMYASIEAFNRGFSYLAIAIMHLVILFIIGKTGFVIHRLRSLKLITVPEYYETRFDKKTRVLAGTMCVLAGVLNMGLFPRMGATFITYATGLADSPNQILVVNIVTSILILLVLLYTVMGGMVSVILTDFIQFIVLSIGMGFGLYYCLSRPDLGWDQIVSTFVEYRGEAALNPFHSESYGWTYMVWMLVIGLTTFVLWAPEASRALTAKDTLSAKRTFIIASPNQFFRVACPAIWAIAAFCFFQKNSELSHYFFPDGPEGNVQHAAQAMPLFIGKIVPTVLLGVLTAGLMSAFMSTHDSYLLCWASVISRDIISPLTRNGLTDKLQIRITRISIVLIGVFLLIWGIWYELPESVWTYMAVTANVYVSGSTPALIGGIYWRKASSIGAFASILCGLFSLTGLFLEPIQQAFPWLSAAVLGLGNYMVCIVAFVSFSLLFPDKQRKARKVI